jgi:hypothetical protein
MLFEAVGAATPGHIIGAELPDHQIGSVDEHVAVEAADAAADGLADTAAVDDLDARVWAQPRKLAPHHLGVGRVGAQHPQPGGG